MKLRIANASVLLVPALLIGGMGVSGCGYRWVKVSEIATRQSAADSAARASLQRQFFALDAQCRADSLRLVSMLKDRPATTVVTVPVPAPAPDSLLKARDAEIASLRDQLARANAELERIKKRLANPKA